MGWARQVSRFAAGREITTTVVDMTANFEQNSKDQRMGNLALYSINRRLET